MENGELRIENYNKAICWCKYIIILLFINVILNKTFAQDRWINYDGTLRPYWKIGKNAGEIKWSNDSTLYYLKYNKVGGGKDSTYYVYTDNPNGRPQRIKGTKSFYNLYADTLFIGVAPNPGSSNFAARFVIKPNGELLDRSIIQTLYVGNNTVDTLLVRSDLLEKSTASKYSKNLLGDFTNAIVYQHHKDSTAFLLAPNDSNTVLYGNLKWKNAGGVDTSKNYYWTGSHSFLNASFTNPINFMNGIIVGFNPDNIKGSIVLRGGNFLYNASGTLQPGSLTSNRTWNLPDTNGTVLLDLRKITINGETKDLSADRSWTVTASTSANYGWTGNHSWGGSATFYNSSGILIGFNPDNIKGQITLAGGDFLYNATGTLAPDSLTASRSWTLPNASGTLALTSQLDNYVTHNDLNYSFQGSAYINTVGTIGTGIWQGSPISDSYIASAATWNGKATASFGSASAGTINSVDGLQYTTVTITINGTSYTVVTGISNYIP